MNPQIETKTGARKVRLPGLRDLQCHGKHALVEVEVNVLRGLSVVVAPCLKLPVLAQEGQGAPEIRTLVARGAAEESRELLKIGKKSVLAHLICSLFKSFGAGLPREEGSTTTARFGIDSS